MEIESLKSILKKLKPSEMLKIFEKWKFFKRPHRQELAEIFNTKSGSRKTKSDLITDLIEYCQSVGELSMETVGDLDILCVQMFSMKKQWSVYSLLDRLDNSTDLSRSPEKFKSKLKELVQLYFCMDHIVSVVLLHGLLWGRVYFPRPGQKTYNPRQNLYFIYYPESPVIIFSGMKAIYCRFLSQCLATTLNYQELNDMCLSGHHYQSLAELAINKQMEGGYIRYRSMMETQGPLNEVTSRKRKASSMIEDSRITDLNRSEKRRCLEALDATFGENIQPTLERVQFKMELPYRSDTVATEFRDNEEQFDSKVRFQGISVLEGLRSLAASGYATLPLPKYLTIIPSRARNAFVLARRCATRTNSSNNSYQVKI